MAGLVPSLSLRRAGVEVQSTMMVRAVVKMTEGGGGGRGNEG